MKILETTVEQTVSVCGIGTAYPIWISVLLSEKGMAFHTDSVCVFMWKSEVNAGGLSWLLSTSAPWCKVSQWLDAHWLASLCHQWSFEDLPKSLSPVSSHQPYVNVKSVHSYAQLLNVSTLEQNFGHHASAVSTRYPHTPRNKLQKHML